MTRFRRKPGSDSSDSGISVHALRDGWRTQGSRSWSSTVIPKRLRNSPREGPKSPPILAIWLTTLNVVLSCLTDDAAVEDVYFESGNLLGASRRYTSIIELSTISPETSRRLHAAGERLGISVLDVSVSGSTHAAESGALTLFGGGERATFDGAEAVFRAIAGQWFHMSPGGAGVAMKLVVNTMLGLGMEAIAESLALGSALGLSHDLLFDTLAKTAVIAPAHAGKLAIAKKSDYAPQFPIRLMHKDFSLILHEASRLKVLMAATKAAAAINADEAASGQEEDFSAVIRRIEQKSKIDRSVPLSGLV